MKLKQPTAQQVAHLRSKAGMTQQQAAELVGLTNYKAWHKVEAGLQPMDIGRWELFLIKTGNHELYKPVE